MLYGQRFRGKSLYGGMICVDCINLAGGVDPIYNAAPLLKLAVETGTVGPANSLRDALDVSDDIAAKFKVRFYIEAQEVPMKAILD